MLDAARVKAGLEPIEQVEGHRQVESASAAARVKMARNPGPLRLAVRPGGAIVDLDEQEDEAARAREAAESRRCVLEHQQGERSVEAEAVRRHDEARAAEVRKLVPQGVLGDRRRLAAHEAGHAAACIRLGVPVRLVDVAGDAESLGRVRHGLEQIHSRDDARKRMLIILCGPIEGAEEWDEVPSWPLDPNASTDEYNLDALADWLDLDERGYDDVKFEALHLTLDREYRMLHIAISGMLDYTPRIGPALMDQLEQIARRHSWTT